MPSPSTTLVWPGPPAVARFAYVQSIGKPADVGIKPSGWAKLGHWLTGLGQSAGKFARPFGIALDEAGNLCLTDTEQARVIYLDRSHKRVLTWDKLGKTDLISPVAIAKRGKTLYVADSGVGAVFIFDEDGQRTQEVRRELNRPSGLVLCGNQLFVADAPAHAIAVFDLQGNFQYKFGRRGSGPGEFNYPTHLAVDSEGHLLVTDSMNSRLELFDASGKCLSVLGSFGDSAGHFNRPKGAAVDAAGRIYVADAMSDALQIFDQTGQFLMDLGRQGAGPGEFWLPNGIAISRDQEIYVTDSYNARVQVFKYIGPPE